MAKTDEPITTRYGQTIDIARSSSHRFSLIVKGHEMPDNQQMVSLDGGELAELFWRCAELLIGDWSNKIPAQHNYEERIDDMSLTQKHRFLWYWMQRFFYRKGSR